MVPHLCVHCGTVEKWTFRVPRSNDASLMEGKQADTQVHEYGSEK